MTATTVSQEREAQQLAFIAKVRKYGRLGFTYGFMGLLAFLFIFPILFMVVAAFKQNDRVIADLTSIQAFLPDPSTLTFDNITDVFSRVPFPLLAFNSIFLTVVTVISGLFVNSLAAFVLARMNWPGKKVILGIIVSLIIIPLEAIGIPLMMQVNEMSTFLNIVITLIVVGLMVLMWLVLWNGLGQTIKQPIVRVLVTALISLPFEILTVFMVQQTVDGGSWINSYHVQILPFIAEPFSIFLFYQFFIGVPKDFDEAAYVDGASSFRIYWQIIVPISRPVFATVAILKFLQFWSAYLWPLLSTNDETYRPLMIGMDNFQTQAPIQWGSIMAYAALVTIPVLIVFLLFQKWFVQSVSSSGVKG